MKRMTRMTANGLRSDPPFRSQRARTNFFWGPPLGKPLEASRAAVPNKASLDSGGGRNRKTGDDPISLSSRESAPFLVVTPKERDERRTVSPANYRVPRARLLAALGMTAPAPVTAATPTPAPNRRSAFGENAGFRLRPRPR